MIELSPCRNANILALAAMLGILSTLALVWQAGEGVAKTSGPSALAASSDDTLYFLAGDTLHWASDDGALPGSVPLESLGLTDGVSRMAALQDGLLLAESHSGRVYRCNPIQRSCALLMTVPMARAGSLLAMAAAPEAERIYVADSGRHQLHVYSFSGKHLYQVRVEGGLRYPNEVRWLGDHRLLVADTNHHRIIIVQDLGGGRSQLVQSIEVGSKQGLLGKIWPTAAVRDQEGRIWAINSDGLLRNGELVVYEPDGNVFRTIGLGDTADPIAVERLSDAVVVADFNNYRLQRFSNDGSEITSFTGSVLARVLTVLQSRQNHWQQIRYGSIGLMVLFGMLGALAAYFDWKERQQRSKEPRRPGVVQHPLAVARPAVMSAAVQMRYRPDARGITWLGVEPSFLHTLRLIILLVLLLPLLVLLPLLQGDLPSGGNWLGGLAVAVTFGMLGILLWMLHGLKRIRIGTDGRQLYLVDMRGRAVNAPPEEFIMTARRLLHGRIAVPLQNPLMALFDKEAYVAVIGPLLARTQRGNELAMLWHDLRRGEPRTWGAVIVVIAVVAVRVFYDW